MSDSRHPYEAYAGTPEWVVIDRAISELARNRDLQEKTAHPYIVGFLCKALADGASASLVNSDASHDELHAALIAAQAEVRTANPTGRDLLAELIAERRAEAAGE